MSATIKDFENVYVEKLRAWQEQVCDRANDKEEEYAAKYASLTSHAAVVEYE